MHSTITQNKTVTTASANVWQDGRASHISGLVWILFAIVFVVTPLGDFLTTKSSMSSEGDVRYSLIIRGCLVAALLSLILARGSVKRAGCTRLLLALIAVAAAAIVCLTGGMTVKEFVEQIIFVSKTFSFFVYIAALSNLSNQQLSRLEPFVFGALVLYAVCIVAGATFSIEMFRSYQADTHIRSGYKGIVYAQNEASALMIVGLSYVYSRVLRSGWKQINVLGIAALTMASLLVGTKAAALGAFAVVCIYFFASRGAMGATVRASASIVLLLIVAVGAYITVPSVQEAANLSRDYFVHRYQHAGDHPLLTILLSGRDQKFAQIWGELARNDFLAIATGGYPVTRYLIEIDVADLVLCLGLPVFCFYLAALRSEFVVRGTTSSARYGRLFFIVLLSLACTAGHTLNSAIVAPYLAFLAVLIRRS